MLNDEDKNATEFEDPLSNFEAAEYSSALEASLMESTVQAIQSRPYAEIKPSTTVREAVYALHGLKVACLLVVDDGKLKGVFTERDVLERVAEQYPKLADQPVSEVMTSKPFVVYANDTAAIALAAIAAAGYRHVPVLEGPSEQLIGIVSPRRMFTFLESKMET